MTKLMEYLSAVIVFFAIWYTLLTNSTKFNFGDEFVKAITFSPVVLIGLFGIYSITVILWRVYSFNDCPEAAEELQQQIFAAKEELKAKGLEI